MRNLLISALAAAVVTPGLAMAQAMSDEDKVKLGDYLVTTSGCHDCHTPLKMGENGPEPDMDRALSGHPSEIAIAAPLPLSDPWMAAISLTGTAISGPWGVSFAANLTPDPETGVLRDYSEAQFIQALRTGRHLGQGRPILPPMPWQVYGQKTDEDLIAIYAYLRQIPAVRNQVPQPLPPAN